MTIKQTGRLTQAERTEISDKKMLEAAVRLIVELGPAATSLKEVGLMAGYSRGLAGQRFGSKDNLYAFVLRHVGEIWLSQLTDATEQKTGLDAIHDALDQHYRFCVEAPDQVRAFYTLWFESVNAGSELSAIIGNIHNRRHQDMVNWINTDPQILQKTKSRADEIAAQFCASVIGIVYYWLANPSDLEETRQLHDNLKNTMTLLIAAE
ncbi:MAG: TetR/AcrR family transcriptional regulator [Pseudomonadales bacterium]|nr:TetR/AcrR family transcriptional regulator [Pseudomonadales bacterium]MBO6566363.1 TetR/AcrR family transcriptional regulator [Pseudomonadales bacterium]MBO6597829.1 TetR/AcrR family transcriptional regulator [Pseudomonadales bacterium]MBO6658824.1 TetR/AcrR family transcriptional regulator [Pseudomonadales bacterium]MBO6702349.1 TetR/AcrR family transcriptional regulator [Pseudomonadales bacterium]